MSVRSPRRPGIKPLPSGAWLLWRSRSSLPLLRLVAVQASVRWTRSPGGGTRPGARSPGYGGSCGGGAVPRGPGPPGRDLDRGRPQVGFIATANEHGCGQLLHRARLQPGGRVSGPRRTDDFKSIPSLKPAAVRTLEQRDSISGLLDPRQIPKIMEACVVTFRDVAGIVWTRDLADALVETLKGVLALLGGSPELDWQVTARDMPSRQC